MLADLFKLIGEQAVQAAKPKVLPLPGERTYLLADGDGNAVLDIPPATRAHTAGSIETLAAVVRELGSGKEAIVWYSRASVVATLDGERRDRVTLPVATDARFMAILELGLRTFKQADLILFLRTAIPGCIEGGDDLVRVLRGIKWRVNSEGQSVVEHGKASLGKSVESDLTGLGALPQCVMAVVPLFEGMPYVGRIKLALEPDAPTQTFKLIPLAGELERELRGAEARLGKDLEGLLEESGAKVYYGQP